MTLFRQSLAEFVGTFSLVFCGTGAIVVDSVYGALGHVGISIVFGLIVSSMIFSFGNISGAHINPAVTFGFLVNGSIGLKKCLSFVLAQILGGLSASLVIRMTFAQTAIGQTLPSGSIMQAIAIEIVITFILMLVILRIPNDQNRMINGALSVGFAVLVLAMFAGPVTGASMNPARSIGPALISGQTNYLWIYLIAPSAGATLAVLFNRVFNHS